MEFLKSEGYFKEIQVFSSDLCNDIGGTFDLQKIDDYCKRQSDEGSVDYYEYDRKGECQKSRALSSRTFFKMFDTGFKHKTHRSPIYIAFARIKADKDSSKNWTYYGHGTTNYLLKRFISSHFNIGNLSFSNYKEKNDFIVAMHGKLLPGEQWAFKDTAKSIIPKTEYPVLESYIAQVVRKLITDYNDKSINSDSENKKRLVFSSVDDYCMLNTGLLSERAEDVYIIGKVMRNKERGGDIFSIQKAVFMLGLEQSLISRYSLDKYANNLPLPVKFFNSIEEIVYFPEADKEVRFALDENKTHVIERIKERCSSDSSKKYFCDLPPDAQLSMLETAIKTANKIALRNYKYVIPQFRANARDGESKFQFLMPLYLKYSGEEEEPDAILILANKSTYFEAKTAIKLSWAISNARVLCTLSDTWLKPSEYSDDDHDDDDGDAILSEIN